MSKSQRHYSSWSNELLCGGQHRYHCDDRGVEAYSSKISQCDEFDKFVIAYSDSMKYAYDSRVKAIRDILFAKRIFDLVKGISDTEK